MRKIIFYSTIGPDRDDEAWSAFSLAKRAVAAGVEAEIFLAGPATGLLRGEVRNRLEGRSKDVFDAVIAAKVPLRVAPG